MRVLGHERADTRAACPSPVKDLLGRYDLVLLDAEDGLRLCLVLTHGTDHPIVVDLSRGVDAGMHRSLWDDAPRLAVEWATSYIPDMPSDSVSDGTVTVDEWESCGGSAVEWLVDAEGVYCAGCGMDPVSASHLARHAYRGSGRLVDVEENVVMDPDDAWDVRCANPVFQCRVRALASLHMVVNMISLSLWALAMNGLRMVGLRCTT